MMRPTARRKPRTSQSTQPEIETIEDVEHLRGLLEQNERLLRTPSLFATSSKSPSAGDDLAQKLHNKNQRIRARIQFLEDQELDRLANGVDRAKLDDSLTQVISQDDAMSATRATPSAKLDLERRMEERFARQAATANGPRKLSMVNAQESHAIQEQEARDHPPAPAVPRFDEDHVAAKGTEDELDTIAKMARMRAYLGSGLGGIDRDWGGFSEEEEDDEDDDDIDDLGGYDQHDQEEIASQSGSEGGGGGIMAMSMDLSEVIKVDVAKTEAVKGGVVTGPL